MKNILYMFCVTVFSVNSYAAVVDSETITSTSKPKLVSPNLIDSFEQEYLGDDYFSAISVTKNADLEEHAMIINVGSPDELFQESFVFSIYGHVLKTVFFKDENEALVVRIVVQGALNKTGDVLNLDGFSEYTLTVDKDENSDTGYSKTALLAKKFVQ